jgi:hypothetical protein
MKKGIAKIVFITVLFLMLTGAVAYDKTVQEETRWPARTIYTLSRDEMIEAAILWLKSKNIKTDGKISAHTVDFRSGIREGMVIIIER